MALEDTTNKQSFTAVAGETHFVFNIPFFDASTIDTANKKYGDIKVTREAAGVITQFTPKETFSVPAVDGEFNLIATNNDPEQGGRVTISVATTGGEKFIVERDVAYSQQYDLQEGSTIDPTALNKALDRVVAQNQQQNDAFTRTIEFPVSDSLSTTYTVGSETTRANKALGFDASGNITEIDLVDAGQISGDTNAGISISNNIISAKVDNSTTQFSSGNIAVKTVGTSNIADNAVTNAKMADNAVETDQIDDEAVTYAKMQHINENRVLGRVTGAGRGDIGEISIDHNLNTVSPAHDTLASALAIKDYVDSKVLRSLFRYRSTSRVSISATSNTTCPLEQVFSDDSSMSVSSDIITLTAGTYLIKADANIFMDNNNNNNWVQGAIVDTGNSDAVLIEGKLLHSYNDYSDDTSHDFSCINRLTLTETKTIALKFRTNATSSNRTAYIGDDYSGVTGMGTPVHATVYIEKLG